MLTCDAIVSRLSSIVIERAAPEFKASWMNDTGSRFETSTEEVDDLKLSKAGNVKD